MGLTQTQNKRKDLFQSSVYDGIPVGIVSADIFLIVKESDFNNAFLSRDTLEAMGFKKIGRDVRISRYATFYNTEEIEIGDFSRIDDFCVVSGKISIGRNVHIANHCVLGGGVAGITFEDFSSCAYFGLLFTRLDDYSGLSLSNATIPRKLKITFEKSILIEKHSRLASRVTILPGSTIGMGASIAINSVVNGEIQPFHLAEGSPAKEIRAISNKVLQAEIHFRNETNS